MVQITIQVGGMMCGMCESHLNNAIRTAFSVKKVTASHSRGRIVIVAEETIDEAALRKVVSDTGYTVRSHKRLTRKSGCFTGIEQVLFSLWCGHYQI